jgi:hypothetical protein
LIIDDVVTNKLQRWNGSAWEELGGGSAGGSGTDSASYHSITPLADSASYTINRPNGTKDTVTVRLADSSVTDRKLAPGIDATKIGAGDVNNAKLQNINSLTSNAQTQLNNKLDSVTLRNDSLFQSKNGTTTFRGKATGSGTGGSVNDFRELNFKIGVTTNAPSAGDSVFVYPYYANKKLDIYEGPNFLHDSTSSGDWGYERRGDTIIFHPAFSTNERYTIHAYPDSNWTYDGLPVPAGYDTDAQAYFSMEEGLAVTTISSTYKTAVSNYFRSVKDSGYWSQRVAFYPFLGTGKINAFNPLNTDAAFRLTDVGGSTVAFSDATGAVFDGSTDALDTHIVEDINMSHNDESFSFSFINGTDGGVVFGAGSPGANTYFENKTTSTNTSLYIQNSSLSQGGANTMSGQFVITNRTTNPTSGIRTIRSVKNGTQLGLGNAAEPVGTRVGGANAVSLYLGAYNNNTASVVLRSAITLKSLAMYKGLTDQQMEAERINMSNLLTALGR